MNKNIERLVGYLKGKKVLFITTSNRWEGSEEEAKSTLLAKNIADSIDSDTVTIMDASKLKIYPCEGNVSRMEGNTCGLKDSILKNKTKNPSGHHRCWASLNNEDDELWKISKELFNSDVVIFFTSVRWGQTNSIYQKLIERLTWIESIKTTLNEGNIVKDIEAGVIVIGHNWKSDDVMKTQTNVLEFFGFKSPKVLSFAWQFTNDSKDESNSTYVSATKNFYRSFLLKESIVNIKKLIKESFNKLYEKK
jgi:multimeric flavodoxin WrbA